MLALLANFQNIILIAFGSILGANARFIIYKKLAKLNLSKIYITVMINTLSSFFLGFLLSFLSNNIPLDYSSQLGLFF